MTKRVGYTEIIAPTPEQITDLERRLQTGELLRVVFENDGTGNVTGAHFRRNHAFQPQVDVNPEIPETIEKFCNHLEVYSMPDTAFRPGAASPDDRRVPRRVRVAPVCDTGGISDAPSSAEYLLVLLAGVIIGAIIAVLTRYPCASSTSPSPNAFSAPTTVLLSNATSPTTTSVITSRAACSSRSVYRSACSSITGPTALATEC